MICRRRNSPACGCGSRRCVNSTTSNSWNCWAPRSSARRAALFDGVVSGLDLADKAFWSDLRDPAVRSGVANVGKFERYFRIFRKWLLPLVHSRATIDAVFTPKPREDRAIFIAAHWSTWRWRLLLNLFFSNRVMGLLGRDPAFFDQVDGKLPDHVSARVSHAAVDLDPSQNPYMRTILTGRPGEALPLAWRAENYETIRARLDRLQPLQGDVGSAMSGEKFDGFNLSDIFEYMDPELFQRVYGALLDGANAGARLVYWNMMAPRSLPPQFFARAKALTSLARKLGARDKAFFYSAFHVDERL